MWLQTDWLQTNFQKSVLQMISSIMSCVVIFALFSCGDKAQQPRQTKGGSSKPGTENARPGNKIPAEPDEDQVGGTINPGGGRWWR